MKRDAANDDAPAPAARALPAWNRETGALTITVAVDMNAALAAIERAEQYSSGMRLDECGPASGLHPVAGPNPNRLTGVDHGCD